MAGINTGSILDLKELALETGSTITAPDGKRFNTGGVMAKRHPLPKHPADASTPAPAPMPVPASAPAGPDMTDILKQLIVAMNRPVEVRLPPMPAPQVVVKEAPAPAPAKAWTFEFERNPNGTIKQIKARSGNA